MTPLQFVEVAERQVQALTDEGDQMHRRAARGRRLVAHLHGWDATANPRPSAGLTELQGGRRVALRIDGQTGDVVMHTLRTTAAAEQFAADVSALLADRPPPIPGVPHEPKRRGRPPLAADAPRSDKRPRSIRLGDEHWASLQEFGIPWLEQKLDAELRRRERTAG